MTTKWAGWIVAALALAALAAGAVYAANHSAEVRITARQLEDGRVEFALQQRVDGEWGERQLPRSRYFLTDAREGQWLNSTPLTVELATEEETESAMQSDAGADTLATISADCDDAVEWCWGSLPDTLAGHFTVLTRWGDAQHPTYDRGRAAFTCSHDNPEPSVNLGVKAGTFVGSEWHEMSVSSRSAARAAARFGTPADGVWLDESSIRVDGNTGIVFFTDSRVWELAKQNRWLSVWLPRYDDTSVFAFFDLTGITDTPVSRYLDACGSQPGTTREGGL